MKEDVERPTELLEITGLPHKKVAATLAGKNAGGVSIGGLANKT